MKTPHSTKCPIRCDALGRQQDHEMQDAAATRDIQESGSSQKAKLTSQRGASGPALGRQRGSRNQEAKPGTSVASSGVGGGVGGVIHVISLGAGVQSSTMALMAAAGEITPMPTAAIFADTQAEPESVYRWLDWLEKELPFPVLRVTKGNLTEMALTKRKRKDGNGQWAKSVIPAYVKNPDGSRGIMQRQCTYDYKMVPLVRTALRLRKEAGVGGVVQWIGISLDEVHRMKPSRDKRIEHRWPLVDAAMKRHDCLRWMEAHGYPKPPRSACVYCPYHSDAEWRRLRDEEPEAFAAAVKFDEDYRRVKQETGNTRGLPYLHASLVPLSQVDFSTDVERGQGVLWGNECEGLCGV